MSQKCSVNEDLRSWLAVQCLEGDALAQLILNEVAAVGPQRDDVASALEAYIKTTGYVEKLFQRHGYDYCCIKAFRVYSHFNTDLNIAVAPNMFPEIIRVLESEGRCRRS